MSLSASSSNRFPELDKYELLEEIGHGGMATVYRGRDQRLGRDVAVKVIHKHLRENAEVRRRFVSEARAVAKLRHRGIVEVYDVSAEEDEERFLVVELIRGPTLRKVLEDHGPLPAEIGAAIVAHLCDAVDHAHSCNVIHRDIKPENVLVEVAGYSGADEGAEDDEVGAGDGEPTEQEPSSTPAPSSGHRVSNAASSARSSRDRVIIKLTDFGIAKVLDAQGVTSTGQILGSPAHMAPEQIEGGEVGPHTDVFALGVLLYECIVGHLPFEGKNPAQVLRRVLEGDFEPADSEQPAVGGRWARLVAATLQVDVEQRIATAQELHQRITTELGALGIAHPLREVTAFFADPEGYRAELVDRLVPLIVKRGEKARRRRQVQNAAADFNRALAFRPDDHTILRRVTSLGSSTAWRRRLVRVGAIAAASALLGGAAFGITRALSDSEQRRLANLSAEPLMSSMISSEPSAPPTGEPSRLPVPSATATTSVARRVPIIRFSNMPSALPLRQRNVRIGVKPAGAKLILDGKPTSFFGVTLSLKPGAHTVEATVPGSNCCRPLSGTIRIEPPPRNDPQAVQHVPLSLQIRPARVRLSSAPPGASMTCPGVGLTATAGVTVPVTMKTLDWTGSCTFNPGGKRKPVHLIAGQFVPVTWP